MYRFFVLLFFCAISAGAAELTAGPYLQNVNKHEITVSWRTDVPTTSVIEYGTEGAFARLEDLNLVSAHEVRITGLSADTGYLYRVLDGNDPLSEQKFFRTAPPRKKTGTVRFAVVGDSGTGGPEQIAIAERMEEKNPSFVLHVGDIVYPDGDLAQYREKFFDPYKTLLQTRAIFPCVGNHDAISIDDYKAVYDLPANESGSGSERYYSFDYGKVHFISLDTNVSLASGSAQLNWFISDLVKNRHKRWKVVFFHHPVYSEGFHGSTAVSQSLIFYLELYRVDLVLNGHDHAYERSRLLNSTGLNKHKVLYIVTGGGGKELLPPSRELSEIEVYKEENHYMLIRAQENRMQIRAINDKGEVIDFVTLRKSGAR